MEWPAYPVLQWTLQVRFWKILWFDPDPERESRIDCFAFMPTAPVHDIVPGHLLPFSSGFRCSGCWKLFRRRSSCGCFRFRAFWPVAGSIDRASTTIHTLSHPMERISDKCLAFGDRALQVTAVFMATIPAVAMGILHFPYLAGAYCLLVAPALLALWPSRAKEASLQP